MKIAILTIGNELTSGKTQDTNASFIARAMETQGWSVSAMMSVGDDEAAIGEALECLLARSSAVVVTGGLGPTADDITTAAIAKAFGLGLVMDEKCLAYLRERFERLRIPWTANNAKQAVFPEGAETIFNPTGSAWGFAVKKDGRIVAVIPGVPAESRRMLPEGVIPLLRREFPDAAQHIETRVIKLFGISESSIDQTLKGVDFAGLGVDIGFYPNFPENRVELTVRTSEPASAADRLEKAQSEVTQRLKKNIFGYGSDTLEVIVARLLTEKKRTLAVAESCTGGLICDRLTDVPGSSSFLNRGLVVYSNQAKTELLGVPEDVLERFGAVSEETARLMAEGVRSRSGVDLGLAVTGIAGPSGGSDEKPVGTVFVALADGRRTLCEKCSSRWDRRRTKVFSSQQALRMLQVYLMEG